MTNSINDIKAAGNAVYILNDSKLYAMDNYSSKDELTMVLDGVDAIGVSPMGCVALKSDKTIWYCGESLYSLYGSNIYDFVEISDDFNKIPDFDVAKFKIYKTYNGMLALDTRSGEIYARGQNRNGELLTGLGTYYKFYPDFVKCPNIKGADNISVTSFVTYFDMDGKTYGCGYNSGDINYTGTTSIQTVPQEVQFSYHYKYLSSGGVIYEDNSGNYFALGDGAYGQLGTGYNSSDNIEYTTPVHVTLVSELRQADNNLYNDAFIYSDVDNKIYGCGLILGEIYPSIKELPFTFPNDPIGIEFIAFNERAVFCGNEEHMYYIGLLNSKIQNTFTEIDFPSKNSFQIYTTSSTESAYVITSMNSDECINTFISNGTYPIYSSDDVYYCANTYDGKSSIKVLYDETVAYFGDPSIIGIQGAAVTEWTDCTDSFSIPREVRDNLLSCKFQVTTSGVMVLTPNGHIYSIGKSVQADLAVNSPQYGSGAAKDAYISKLTKTKALNAVHMNHGQMYSYYINGSGELFIGGSGIGLGFNLSDLNMFECRDFTRSPFSDIPGLEIECTKTSFMLFSQDDKLYVSGIVLFGEAGITSGAYPNLTKINLPVPLSDIIMFDKGTNTNFTYFLTKDGSFYFSGKIPAGVSGNASQGVSYSTFTKIDLPLPSGVKPEDVLELNAASNSALMTTNTQDAYYCGASKQVNNGNNIVTTAWTKLKEAAPRAQLVTDFKIIPKTQTLYCGMKGIPTWDIEVTPAHAAGYILTKRQIIDPEVQARSNIIYHEDTDTFDIPTLEVNSYSIGNFEYVLRNFDGSELTQNVREVYNELFIGCDDVDVKVGDTLGMNPTFYINTTYYYDTFKIADSSKLLSTDPSINIKINSGVSGDGTVAWGGINKPWNQWKGTATTKGQCITNILAYFNSYDCQLRSIENVKSLSKEERAALEKDPEHHGLNLDTVVKAKLRSTKDFNKVVNIKDK